MKDCNGHFAYASRADAEQALADLVADAKRTGRGGKSYKRLNVWPCRNHFHVGRRNKLPKSYTKPVPQDKLPTFGQARRWLARMDRELERTIDYCMRKRIAVATRLVELDRAAGWID